jgi:hypothetical protein
MSEDKPLLLNNSKLNLLFGALAAGLCVRAFEFVIYILGDFQSNLLREVKFTLIAVASYLAVALLLSRFWKGKFRRLLPVWLLVAFWGSLLYESIVLVPSLIYFWNTPNQLETNLFKFILTELGFARTTFILNFFIALFVMAIIRYADTSIQAVKNWHYQTQDSLSILSKPTLKK